MCVIDETIGFMGGLDLCFGRYVFRLLSISRLLRIDGFDVQMGFAWSRYG